MTPAAARIVGAVLAGGKSARMGRDKAALVVPGAAPDAPAQTLGDRAVAVLREVCAGGVVALGHARGIPGDVPRIKDAVDDIGPLGGLLALLESGRGDVYVVLPVDMPFVTARALRALLDALAATAATATVAAAVFEGEPLPLAVRASCAGAVRRAVEAGERRLSAVVDALVPTQLAITDRAALQNLNTQADFDAYARRTAGR